MTSISSTNNRIKNIDNNFSNKNELKGMNLKNEIEEDSDIQLIDENIELNDIDDSHQESSVSNYQTISKSTQNNFQTADNNKSL